MQPELHFTAVRSDGTIITESASVGFEDTLEADLVGFAVHVDGQTFGVDLLDGSLIVNSEKATPRVPLTDKPRLVYYKRMRSDMNQATGASEPYVYFVAVGWQATDKAVMPWKNIRQGIKVYPQEARWEMTEDI